MLFLEKYSKLQSASPEIYIYIYIYIKTTAFQMKQFLLRSAYEASLLVPFYGFAHSSVYFCVFFFAIVACFSLKKICIKKLQKVIHHIISSPETRTNYYLDPRETLRNLEHLKIGDL